MKCENFVPPTKGLIIRNRFIVKSLIGVGSFGYVYSAHDEMQYENVAIKFEMKITKR